ncbi:MAG: cytochrome C [Deltaproteobacteria bacterium]|nr:cytochrome C [Candidatus Anaeroferrophillus wilburensis]MBN2888545.1 cytochrome C [Deltaproteobacteria bacterium]
MKKIHLTTALLAAVILLFGMVGSSMAIHPDIDLLDADGNPISSAGGLQPAFSYKTTCGACHNGVNLDGEGNVLLSYDDIEQHSLHAQLSANQFMGWNIWNPDSANSYKKGPAPKGKNWVQSPGHFGKW